MKKEFHKFYKSYKNYVAVKPQKSDYSTMTKLAEETGEVAEAMAAFWGSKTKIAKFEQEGKTVNGALKEEIGDCIVVLFNLATACNITHEELFEAMTKKVNERAAGHTKE